MPVYNAAAHLEQSLDSIAAQTYGSIEVVLVDDGSTDASPAICDARCAQDTRFRVVHNENRGAASARNTGLQICRGSWIMCCDADDLLATDAIEVMMRAASVSGSCGAICNSIHIGPHDTTKIFESLGVKNGISSVASADALTLLYSDRFSGCGPWAKFFPARTWSSIAFPEGRRFEDFPIIWRLFSEDKEIALVSKPLYAYRKGIDSVTSRASESAAADLWASISELDNAVGSFPHSAAYAHAFQMCLVCMRLYEMAAMGLREDARKRYMSHSINMFNRYWNKAVRNSVALPTQRIRILLFRICPTLSVKLKRLVSVRTSANWG